MSITLKDIAKRAGVSYHSVCKVLNKKDSYVGEETKNRILTIAKDLSYRPNHFAQSLKSGQTKMIGIVTISHEFGMFDQPYSAKVYQGIGEFFAQHDYRLIFYNYQQMEGIKNINKPLNLADSSLVDGMIVLLFSHEFDEFRELVLPGLKKRKIPFVVVHSLSDVKDMHSVGVDCRQGGYDAGMHLLSHNYWPIGYVRRDSRIGHTNELICGFEKAMQDKDKQIDPKFIYNVPSSTAKMGYNFAKKNLSDKREIPRALFLIDEALQRGVDFAFSEEGIKIPEQVALFSFGALDGIQFNFSKSSSIIQPAVEKGFKAAEMLLGMLKNKDWNNKTMRKFVIKPKLNFRRSCGCSSSPMGV